MFVGIEIFFSGQALQKIGERLLDNPVKMKPFPTFQRGFL